MGTGHSSLKDLQDKILHVNPGAITTQDVNVVNQYTECGKQGGNCSIPPHTTSIIYGQLNKTSNSPNRGGIYSKYQGPIPMSSSTLSIPCNDTTFGGNPFTIVGKSIPKTCYTSSTEIFSTVSSPQPNINPNSNSNWNQQFLESRGYNNYRPQ